MNYRHAYHAGNFADVVKHLLLTLVIEHLKLKPAPFRVIDTHAGVGAYDLSSVEAGKTGEWTMGIGRVLAAAPPPAIAPIFAPYLAAIAACNGGAAQASTLRYYPGSPMLARFLMRDCDMLVVNELHPEDRVALADTFARDRQVKVLGLDGWQALKSLLPPKERRGVILVDPPFEQAGEFDRLAAGIIDVVRRFATGTLILWYPVKDLRPVTDFHRRLKSLGVPKLLVVELMLREPVLATQLNGTGLVVLNPPFTLAEQLRQVMPYLIDTMKQGAGALWRVETIA